MNKNTQLGQSHLTKHKSRKPRSTRKHRYIATTQAVTVLVTSTDHKVLEAWRKVTLGRERHCSLLGEASSGAVSHSSFLFHELQLAQQSFFSR